MTCSEIIKKLKEKKPGRTLLTIFCGTAAVDSILENLWQTNNWLMESLVTTATAVTWAISVSAWLNIWEYKTRSNDNNRNDQTSFTLRLAMSEILSGAVSFGLGVALDFAMEKGYSHHSLDTAKNIAWSTSFALLKASTRTLAFYCFFKPTRPTLHESYELVENYSAINRDDINLP